MIAQSRRQAGRIHILLMPTRAAVDVQVKRRAIQATTILKYGLNGHERTETDTSFS